MSKFLENKCMNIKIRTLLCFVLCIFNFLFAYGAAIYYNQGQSPVMLYIGIIGTVLFALLLAFPNTQKDSE